jgi:hypothetical protein
MRNVLALGAAIIFVGAASMAIAQERLQSNQSGMGVGEGVGDVSGSSSRVTTFDRTQFLDRLSQPETVYGRVLAIDIPAGKMFLETGGSSHDEGRAGGGSMNSLVVYLDDRSNMDQIRTLNVGDDLSLQVVESTTYQQQFGTGKKLVREVMVIRGNEKLAGFGGLGQRPNPATERGINTNSGSTTGGIGGAVLPGKIESGITSTIGEFTGSAPCWQCEPQPGWGNAASGTKSDYGADYTKPNLVKGLN